MNKKFFFFDIDGTAPNDEQYAVAMEELEKAGEALCQK